LATIQFPAVLGLQREPQTREHEPRGLLGHPKGAPEFVAADAVLAVGDEPQGRKPLLERDWRVLKDGSDLQRELRLGVFGVALPAADARHVGDVLGAAMRTAHNTIGPADFADRLMAVLVIAEEQDRLLESFGFGVARDE
jgi:hypothetical protein